MQIYNTFLNTVFAARVSNENVVAALEQISTKLSVTVGNNKERIRLFFWEPVSENTYKLFCKVCSSVNITEEGIDAQVSPEMLSSSEIEIAKLTITNSYIEIFAVNDALVDRYEVNYISNMLKFVRKKLGEILNIPIQFRGITNIETEIYKDDEGQYRSTEYGYFIKSVFEDVRAKLLVYLKNQLYTKVFEDMIATKTNQDKINEQLELLIVEYINSNGFEQAFRNSLHELFSLSKITNIDELVDTIINEVLKSDKFQEAMDKFFSEYSTQEDLDIRTKTDSYKLGFTMIALFYSNFFKKITEKFNDEIRSKREPRATKANQINFYKQVFAVDKKELEKNYETYKQAVALLLKIPKKWRDLYKAQMNDFVLEFIESKKEEEAVKEEEQLFNPPKITISDSVKKSVAEYVADNGISFDEETGKYYNVNTEEVKVEDIIDQIQEDLNVQIDKANLEDIVKSTMGDTVDLDTGVDVFNTALTSDGRYKSFANKAKVIVSKLEALNDDLQEIKKDFKLDAESKRDKAAEKLLTNKDLPQDIYNILKDALLSPLNPDIALEKLISYVIAYYEIAVIFTEELDYKSAQTRSRAIINVLKSIERYYKGKSPETVELNKTKVVLPGSNVRYVGNYFKEQSAEILNALSSSEDKAFIDIVKAFQQLLQDARDKINNINI